MTATGPRSLDRRLWPFDASVIVISNVHVPELEEKSIPPVPEVESADAVPAQQVAAPGRAARNKANS